MKKIHQKCIMKAVSGMLAASMSLSLFTTMPVSAETGKTTYNYEGYSVEYNVTNEWDGAQTVELKVSNTGDESILNWALKYDTDGEISNLWNASVYEQNADEYVIKNAGWNFEIAPNQSVTYGYTLNGNDLALPDSFEIYSKRVDKTEGYDLQYNITKSWDTGVEGNIVITNNSDAPIEAWTLSFDSNFTINNLWNGRVLENNETSYKIAAEMWTNPVQPNGSMTIGFVGSKAADVEALLSNFRLTEVIIGEGTPVTPIDPPEEKIEITANAEYNEETDNVTVSWITNNPDGTFDILMSADGENFTSVGTVENVSEFVYTPATDFDAYHFKVIQTVGEQTAESNVVSVVKSAEDIAISAEAVYDEESGSITVKWTTNKPNGTFDVLMSFDGESFTSVGTVENAAEFIYTPDEFDTLYFKVKQTAGAKTAESNVVSVVYTVDWSDKTDTDNDGLPDVYEKQYFETDPENADTDGDGLPDGYEVYCLGTNPKKADSDDNGVPDSDEDFDKDGLNNLREYELGTDPNNADSDSDGLSDSDEVNTYNTDPLKYDTDADGISDGDEIALGLDPNSASTDGVPDSERTFVQHIGADSENLAAVNTDENPFKVSIDITAAGVAANNLVSHESGYSNAIRNDAILGITPEFIYTDGLKVEDVVINFDISESAAANTNGKYTSLSDEFVGIKRLNVFKFFEDTNMLLPIETFHDVENNRVYTHVDELGTYCLMDMEVWLEGLDIAPEEAEANAANEAVPMLFSAMTYSEEAENTENVENTEEDQQYIDVVLIAYPNKSLLDETKSELKTTCKSIFEQAEIDNIDARIFFVSFLGNSIETPDGNIYVSNYEEAEEIINRHMGITSALSENSYALYKALNYSANNCVPQFRENSDRFCFVIDVCGYPRVDSGIGAIAKFNENNVRLSFSYNANNTNILNYNLLSSGACEAAVIGGGRYNFEDFIIREIFGEHENEYPIISAVGWKRINLDEPITEEYFTRSIAIDNDPSLRDGVIALNKYADTDKDGLLDLEEIMFRNEDGKDLISFDSNGNAVLPNFEDCTGALPQNRKLFYVKNGLLRYADVAKFQDFYKLRILPIKSDPTSEDSDEDGIQDSIDDFALIYDDIPSQFKALIISENVKYDDILIINEFDTSEKVYLCNIPMSEIWNKNCFLDISAFDNKGNLSNADKYLNDYYILAYGEGSTASYYATKWYDLSYIKKIKVLNTTGKIRKYTKINYEELKREYTSYDLWSEVSAKQEMWLKNVQETDEKYIGNIRESFSICTNLYQYTPKSVCIRLVSPEADTQIREFEASVVTGFEIQAYKTISGVTKLPSTILMQPKSVIESDYIYRQECKEKYGFDPGKYSIYSSVSYMGGLVEESAFILIDDFDSAVSSGSKEELGEYIGGALWDVCFAVYLSEVNTRISDEISNYRITTGKKATIEEIKNIPASKRTSSEQKIIELYEDIDGVYKAEWDLIDKSRAFNVDTALVESYNSQLSVIGSDYAMMLSDCRAYSNSLITLTTGKETIVKSLLISHYDDFIDGISRYGLNYANLAVEHGEQFVKAISTYPQYADDIIKLASLYGSNFIEIASKGSNTGEIVAFISKYADDGIETLLKKFDASGTDQLIVESELFLKADGSINWDLAPNGGRVPNTEKYNQLLGAGTYIDRYGSIMGKYVSPFGVPYTQRSLPYVENPKAYHVYLVKKDIVGVTSSKIAKAFNGTGGGTQYELPLTIRELLTDGYLVEVI